MTPGGYIIEGLNNHYFFDAMNINIEPNSRQIPNLVASGYQLCGKITIDTLGSDSKPFSINKRSVIL